MVAEAFDAFRSDIVLDSKVIGSYDPMFCFSWHDDSVPFRVALGTLVHESVHSGAICGTYFHFALVLEYYNRMLLNISPPFDETLLDHVSFHESCPKAYDILTDSQISFYKQPDIVERAKRAVEIVNKIYDKCGLSELSMSINSLKIILLLAVYQAIGDAYQVSARVSGLELLEALRDIVDRKPKSQLLPPGLNPSLGITFQFRRYLNFLLGTEYDYKMVE